MKRVITLTSTLLLVLGFTAGCIVVNIERKPESGSQKEPAKAKEVEVTTEGDVSSH